MTAEDARARAEAIEKKARHEYYMANRDRILERMSEYGKTHRKEKNANCRKYREKDPIHYAELQLKYWQKKLDELRGGQNV